MTKWPKGVTKPQVTVQDISDPLPDLPVLLFELRKLYERYPFEFKRVVEELHRRGCDEVLPPAGVVRGKPKKVTDQVLAMLLTDCRHLREDRSMSREGAIHYLAVVEREYRYPRTYAANKRDSKSNKWTTESAINKHLKSAEARIKTDPGFAALVNSCKGRVTFNILAKTIAAMGEDDTQE